MRMTIIHNRDRQIFRLSLRKTFFPSYLICIIRKAHCKYWICRNCITREITSIQVFYFLFRESVYTCHLTSTNKTFLFPVVLPSVIILKRLGFFFFSSISFFVHSIISIISISSVEAKDWIVYTFTLCHVLRLRVKLKV